MQNSVPGTHQIDDENGEEEDADVEPFCDVVEDASWLMAYDLSSSSQIACAFS